MNIAFSLTKPQIRAGTKDVTRRLGWENLQPGEVLDAIEKGQGLKKGEHVKVMRTIRVVSARREPLDRMISEPGYGAEEVRREGFPELTPQQFVDRFCRSHRRCKPKTNVTRIEFTYEK